MGLIFNRKDDDYLDDAIDAFNRYMDTATNIAMKNLQAQVAYLSWLQDRYSGLEGIFGDMFFNLRDYYDSLTGEDWAARQLSNQAFEYQRAMDELERSMAQRGMSGSGMEAAAMATMGSQSARDRAKIRSAADEVANRQKMGFLSFGMPMQQKYIGQTLGAMGNQMGQIGRGFGMYMQPYLTGMGAAGNFANRAYQNTYNTRQGLLGSGLGLGGMWFGKNFL